MIRIKLLMLFISGSILLGLAGCQTGENQNHNGSQDNSLATKPQVKSQGIISSETGRAKHQASVNNVKQGHRLKAMLDSHPEITHYHHNQQDTSHSYDHEAIVIFRENPDGETIRQLCETIDGSIIKQNGRTVVFKSQSLETGALLDKLREEPKIHFAEPHYILVKNDESQTAEMMPNDHFYVDDYQWNLPAIAAEEGWKTSRGSDAVKIAIVDTGVDLDHPDLVNRLDPGYNAIDETQPPNDDNGHGTHVAGIIAAETNNLEGTAGITWYNRIIPVKSMGSEGYGSTFDIAKGIIWAADNGADIINMSLGNYQDSSILREAVSYAYNKGVTLIAAAGNDNTNQPSYPASYPEVMSVSAIDYNGRLAQFSNYGENINVAAPGVSIASTYFENQYASLSGTSMAAPHVTGLAGLIKSLNPELNNQEIMQVIENSATDIGTPGHDQLFGSGIINVNQALADSQNGHIQEKTRRRTIFDLFFR